MLIPIPGLYLGSDQDVRYKDTGYISFLRNTTDPDSLKTAETKNFECYNEKILLPFIDNCRKKYFNYDKARGDVLTDTLTAVCWCDGCNSQLTALTTEANLEIEEQMKIRRMKVGAASTGCQQSADLCNVFPQINSLIKKTTAEKMSNVGFKQVIHDLFETLKKDDTLNMSATKTKGLTDFIVTFPTILAVAAKPKNVINGFLANGQIDEKSYYWPDFNCILGTCKNEKVLTQDNVNLIIDNFQDLYLHQVNEGHITDEVFSRFDFPKDVDLKGNVVERNYGINNEKCHRAKSLSHVAVRNERIVKLNEKVTKKNTKILERNEKIKAIHHLNDKCIDELKKVNPMIDDETLPGYLNRLRMSDFAKKEVTKPLLEDFVHVREFTSVNRMYKLPNKGNLKEIEEQGCVNLIKVAFEKRNEALKLPIPSETADTDLVQFGEAPEVVPDGLPIIVREV